MAVFHPPDVGFFGRTIFAYGALWEVGQRTGRLLRVDPATGAASVIPIPGYQPLSGGYEIFPIAADGSVWVANVGDGTVWRDEP